VIQPPSLLQAISVGTVFTVGSGLLTSNLVLKWLQSNDEAASISVITLSPSSVETVGL